MKRFITMIVAACAFFAASAQFPMVTLSHNGELSFFTNVGAFQSAYDAAENGDILYLSDGEFILDKGALKIEKRLSIVGTGYRSHILGDVTFNMTDNPNSEMDAPLFDGVRLDKLSFSTSSTSVQNLRESEIRRCWIRVLENGAYAGTDVLYDKCYIERADFYGTGNVVVKNSKLSGHDNTSSADAMYNITAINCNMDYCYSYPKVLISCIFSNNGKSGQPSVNSGTISIISSLLDFTPSSSSVYTHDCYIADSIEFDGNLDLPEEELKTAGYLGQDGTTVVGIHGGEDPFSENPSVPTVDTANSSVEYDATGNKLKVSITVKAD